jgi:HSP20 family protein
MKDMSLIRYTPFANLDAIPDFRAFQDTVSRLFAEPNGRPWVPAVDIRETENELVFKADVPDMELKDIDLQLENGTLTLRGSRKFESTTGDKKDGGWHRVERSYGRSSRCLKPSTLKQ